MRIQVVSRPWLQSYIVQGQRDYSLPRREHVLSEHARVSPDPDPCHPGATVLGSVHAQSDAEPCHPAVWADPFGAACCKSYQIDPICWRFAPVRSADRTRCICFDNQAVDVPVDFGATTLT